MNDKEFTSLQDLRNRIDSVDRELVRLFVERMHTSAAVAEWKRENGKPVFDAARERALISRVSQLSGREFEEYTRVLYATIMGLSRAYQHKCLNDFSGTSGTIRDMLDRTPQIFPERAAVACQGVEGAYSQIAAERLFKAPEISFYTSFSDVFDAISSGTCRYGVLPIENSTAGSVTQVYDLMEKHSFHIVGARRLRIDHHLLRKPGATGPIRRIVSHEQALRQCSEFLSAHPEYEAVAMANTAVAAQFAADSERDDVAVIAAKTCAELYNLEVVGESVSNVQSNYTRFICISRRLEIYRGARKISIMCNLPHEAGSLNSVISRLAIAGINLCKLESRPIPGRDFEFRFFFDLEADPRDPEVVQLLCELERKSEHFVFLGAYEER